MAISIILDSIIIKYHSSCHKNYKDPCRSSWCKYCSRHYGPRGCFNKFELLTFSDANRRRLNKSIKFTPKENVGFNLAHFLCSNALAREVSKIFFYFNLGLDYWLFCQLQKSSFLQKLTHAYEIHFPPTILRHCLCHENKMKDPTYYWRKDLIVVICTHLNNLICPLS